MALSSTSSALMLTRPFTPNTLELVREALRSVAPPTLQPHSKSIHAAVLIPFCNVDGKPGILLEVRGKSLRSHPGEVRYARSMEKTEPP